MRWVSAVVVFAVGLLACGKTPPNRERTGGQGGGLAGSAGLAGGQSGGAGRGQATGGATAAGGGGAPGSVGVNGPSGPGPIVSFGVGEELRTVAWSGSLLVALGSNETIVESSGTSGQWALNGTSFLSGGGDLLWDGTRFVTVSQSGAVNVSAAADAGRDLALNVTGRYAPPYINALARSGSTYVGVGAVGLIATSADALTWTTRTSGTTDSLVDVVWTGSQFLALGTAGAILTSADGAGWTVQRAALTTGATFNAVAWSGSRFVVVGNGFTETSTDGKTWTKTGATAGMTCVAWSPQLHLFAGAAAATMYTSPDGATWTFHATPLNTALHSIVWAGNRFVVVGAAGTILSSQDGARWIVESLGTSLTSVTWTGERFVAGGAAGTHLSSPDGLSWTIGYFDTPYPLASVTAWPDGIAFGAQTNLIYTTDLIKWTSASIGPTSCPGLIWNGSQCLAVCGDGSFWGAADCQTWARGQIAAATNQWSSVVWTGSQFVAVGAGGLIATSPDGMKWTTQVSGTTKNLSGIAWSGTQLVAVGDGVATTSTDGVAWTAGTVIQSLTLRAVAWAGTRFLAIGPQATLLESPDGVTWSGTAATVPVNSLLASSLNAIAFSGTRSIVVGDNGTILAVDR